MYPIENIILIGWKKGFEEHSFDNNVMDFALGGKSHSPKLVISTGAPL